MSKYLNPFHILEDTLEEDVLVDARMWRRMKKRVLAEFDLSEETTISISTQTFDKDSVLKFFEQLERENALDVHYEIFKNQSLLNFLEQGDLTFFKTPNALEKLVTDQRLFYFVLPYFLPKFNEVLFDAVRKKDIRLTRLLASSAECFPATKEGQAFQKSYRYLKAKSLDVERISKRMKREHVLDSEIMDFLHPSLMTVFNLMPRPYFNNIRLEFALKMEELALSLHNTSRRTDLAIEALEAGLELDTNENTEYRLNYVLKQLQLEPPKGKKAGKRTLRTSEVKSKHDWKTIVYWVIQVIIFFWLLFRLVL